MVGGRHEDRSRYDWNRLESLSVDRMTSDEDSRWHIISSY